MAKTRGRQNAYYVVKTQEGSFYDVPDFTNTREYVDDIKLEEGQWFVVENFSQKDYCIDFLQATFDNTAYSNLPRDIYPNLAFIVSVQGDIFCFQKIVTSTVLHKKIVDFKLNQEPDVIDCKHAIVLSNDADGYYDKAADKLYFKKLSSLTSIFDGISVLYNEATNEETGSFLDLDILNIGEGYGINDVKTANRRRIKAAMDKYNGFNNEQRAAIPTYLQKYVDDVPFEDGKFNVNNEEDLTKILNCLSQRYYTTEIDEEKRLANSVTPL